MASYQSVLKSLLVGSSIASIACAGTLISKTVRYLSDSSRIVPALVFNKMLAGAIFSLAELETIIAIWSAPHNLRVHCVIAREVQCLVLTVMAIQCLLLGCTFVLYATNCKVVRRFKVVRFVSFLAWPFGMLVHAMFASWPAESYSAERQLCVEPFHTVGNLFSGILVNVALVLHLISFTTWFCKGSCFPRALDAAGGVRLKNGNRLLFCIAAIVPNFVLLDYCELRSQLHGRDDCPALIQDIAELASSSFVWFAWVCSRYLEVEWASWRDVGFQASERLESFHSLSAVDAQTKTPSTDSTPSLALSSSISSLDDTL